MEHEKVNALEIPTTSTSTAEGTAGEVASAKPEDTLKRGFKGRHVSMFAIAGSIGTGLLIGSGTGLARGGPASMLIAYASTGIMLLNVLSAFGEMAVFMPMDKGFSGYAARLVDPAFGFAIGINYFLKYVVLLANNLTAAGIIMQYWLPSVNVGVWITVYAVPIICFNCLSARRFGEIEFWLASIKTIVIVTLIITCVVIAGGGAGERIGFRYWDDPGAFKSYLVVDSTGKFLGFWACMTNAVFAYMGAEMVGITFGEAKEPWKSIPKALSATFWRILFFYVGGVFVVGLCVSSSSTGLIDATKARTGADASPFVLAIRNAGIPVFPDVINAALLIFVLSAANTDIYLASRTLYGLSKDGYVHHLFSRLNRSLPYIAIAFSSIFFLLAYMSTTAGSSTVFKYLVSFSTVLGLLNWVGILVSYLRFRAAMRAQNISRDVLPYRGRFQEWRAGITLFVTVLIVLTNGFAAFVGSFKVATFITSYLGTIIFLCLIAGFKVYQMTTAGFDAPLLVGLCDLDLTTDTVHKADLEVPGRVEGESSLLSLLKRK